MVDSVGGDGGDNAPEPDGAGHTRPQAGVQRSTERSEALGAEQAVKQQQSREENSAIRAARIRARREAEAEARARMDEEIAGLGIVDPYDKSRTFRSMKELREYQERFRRDALAQEAKKTGRSVEEVTEDAANREYVSRKRREEAEQTAAAERAREQKRFFENDVLDFIGKYPQFDQKSLAELENNQKFRRFCGSRFGREPLSDLYGAYLEVVGEAGAAAVAKATSRQQRSTGSGSTGGVQLSPAQKAALDTWNAEHPEMAMTAKEFLRR